MKRFIYVTIVIFNVSLIILSSLCRYNDNLSEITQLRRSFRILRSWKDFLTCVVIFVEISASLESDTFQITYFHVELEKAILFANRLKNLSRVPTSKLVLSCIGVLGLCYRVHSSIYNSFRILRWQKVHQVETDFFFRYYAACFIPVWDPSYRM